MSVLFLITPSPLEQWFLIWGAGIAWGCARDFRGPQNFVCAEVVNKILLANIIIRPNQNQMNGKIIFVFI